MCPAKKIHAMLHSEDERNDRCFDPFGDMTVESKAVGEPPCATYLFEIKTVRIIDISLAFRSHAGLTEASKSCYNDSPFAASLIHPAWSAPKICSTVGEGYRGGGARLRHLKLFFCVGYLCLSSAPFTIGWAWSRTNCSLQAW